VLDEPTTGLHFADIHKLLEVLQKLVQTGNTVLVIEHNLDVIKTADYLIDLGPEGGDRGGTVVGTGTPEELALNPESYTGSYLVPVLEDQRAVGHHVPDASALERLERENMTALDDLAKGDRVAIEA
jgi:excinuclease ABC subunit A